MDLPTILLISAAISIGATVIAVLVALRSAREARTAIFPIVREEESTRARRARVSILVWIAVTTLLLGGWLASRGLITVDDSSLISDAELAQPAESGVVEFTTPPPSEILPADTVVPPATSASTSEPSIDTSPVDPPTTAAVASPTPAPDISNPTPTETPPPVPPTATLTPVPLGPAPSSAQMGPIEFATEIASPIKAVNPGEVFSTGIKIYAVYPYWGMQNGTSFAAIWYQNGLEIARDERGWAWGWQGHSYSFLIPPGAGQYKLELYVNDSLLTSGSFEIR